MTKLKKKMNSIAGETLVESLAAMVIVVMAMTMLASSIVTAVRVNQKAKNVDTGFQKVVISAEGREDNLQIIPGEQKVRVKFNKRNLSSPEEMEILEYKTKDKNQYIFYEVIPEE